jgi:hypothetical protein
MAAAVVPRPPSSHCRHGASLPAPQHKAGNTMLGDRFLRRCRKWGSVAADVHHLGHNVSTDVVELLWVVSCVGICRVIYQTIVDAFPTRRGRASPSASEQAWQPPLHHAESVAMLHGLGRFIMHEGMMHGGSSGKIGGRGAGGKNIYNRQLCTLIDHGGCNRPTPTATMGPHSRHVSIIQQSVSIQ